MIDLKSTGRKKFQAHIFWDSEEPIICKISGKNIPLSNQSKESIDISESINLIEKLSRFNSEDWSVYDFPSESL
jgi:hypothetical protein